MHARSFHSFSQRQNRLKAFPTTSDSLDNDTGVLKNEDTNDRVDERAG